MTERSKYRAKLQELRAMEAEHDIMMTEIANRGGLTLEQLREMTRKEKDVFITAHRIETQEMKEAA